MPSIYFDIQDDGKRGPWRPKMTWWQLTEGLQRAETLDPLDRDTCRSGVRYAMHAASQLPMAH